jgi:nucleoside-diphosphate-sugar epimerase
MPIESKSYAGSIEKSLTTVFSTKTVLVTGGSGFLGNALAKKLLSLGSKVKTFSRSNVETLGANHTHFCGNIVNSVETQQAVEGVDLVFHTAAMTHYWGAYEDFYNVNVIGTQNILQACKHFNVPDLVYTSTPSVAYTAKENIRNQKEQLAYLSNYLSHYPSTKAIAEQEVLNAEQLNTIALRPHLIWGKGDPHILPRLIDTAKQGKLFRMGNTNPTVDMTHVDNAVEAHIAAAKALFNKNKKAIGQAYFISDDNPVQIWTWLNHLLNELEMKSIESHIPLNVANGLGHFLEILYKTFPFKGEPRLTRFLVNQLAHDHFFDISKAKNLLSYKPVVNYEQTLEEYIHHLKGHYSNS